MTTGPRPLPPMKRVERHVRVTESGCHEWTGALGLKGYPQMQMGSLTDGTRRPRLVHRVVWEAAHGPRPAGFDVHHRCENKRCVNLLHLTLVTHGGHSEYHGRTDPGRGAQMAHALHVRWHVNRGLTKPGCSHCEAL
jgi:HNH endonuclease